MHRRDTWMQRGFSIATDDRRRRTIKRRSASERKAAEGNCIEQFCNSAIWIRVHCYGRRTAGTFEAFALRVDDAVSGGDSFLNNNSDRSYLSRYYESLNDRIIDCLCYVCIATRGPNDDHRRPF